MSNSYQRAKARVKELEEQNLLIQRELSAYKESDAQLSNDLCNANHKLKLAEHFAKLSEKDIKEKNEIIASNKRAIKSLAITAIILTWAIILLIALS
jgi:ATP/maltotriose-dependent transcriptional regulator MalT